MAVGRTTACTCPAPRVRQDNQGRQVCITCGRLRMAEPAHVALRIPEWRTDHTLTCTCFACVMERRGRAR